MDGREDEWEGSRIAEIMYVMKAGLKNRKMNWKRACEGR